MPKIKPEPKTVTAKVADPANLNARVYRHMGLLLDRLDAKPKKNEEPIDLRTYVATLTAIIRIQVLFGTIRKGISDDVGSSAGSAVRKYAKAFTNAGRRRAAGAAAADVVADVLAGDDSEGDGAA